MIFVRNQWLIDRGPAPGWGEEQLCIPTNKYTNVFLRARYADAHTECREQHYCSPILIMAKSWLETTRRTRDVLMVRDRGEVRVCGLNYRAAAFCMFPYRVYYGGAMNCELPLLVSAMATFLLPCSLFFNTGLRSRIQPWYSIWRPNRSVTDIRKLGDCVHCCLISSRWIHMIW